MRTGCEEWKPVIPLDLSSGFAIYLRRLATVSLTYTMRLPTVTFKQSYPVLTYIYAVPLTMDTENDQIHPTLPTSLRMNHFITYHISRNVNYVKINYITIFFFH